MGKIFLFPVKHVPITEKAKNQIYGQLTVCQKIVESFIELYPFEWTIEALIKNTLLNSVLNQKFNLKKELEGTALWRFTDSHYSEDEFYEMARIKNLDLVLAGVFFEIENLYGENSLKHITGVEEWLKRHEREMMDFWTSPEEKKAAGRKRPPKGPSRGSSSN